MNRSIKFRTWDTENKEFSEWTNRDPFFSTSHGQIFFWERTRKEDRSYDGDIIIEDTGNRFILQQFTGLQDKNGKEVFEGDILQYRDGSHQAPYYDKVVVEWISENDGYDYSGWKLTDNFLQGGQFKVIGNIFENPDLLQ
jgi:uncharacterized phage protein (TIGR01671 family)